MMADLMTEREYLSIINKQRRLPAQLAAARRRVAALEREALRYGLVELVNSSWDNEISNAQADAHAQGGSIGFGDGVEC